MGGHKGGLGGANAPPACMLKKALTHVKSSFIVKMVRNEGLKEVGKGLIERGGMLYWGQV